MFDNFEEEFEDNSDELNMEIKDYNTHDYLTEERQRLKEEGIYEILPYGNSDTSSREYSYRKNNQQQQVKENDTKKEIKNAPAKTAKLKMTRKGKRLIKSVGSIGAALLLMLCAKGIYNVNKEKDKQSKIDSSISQMSDEYRKFLTQDPKEIAQQFSKEEREDLQKFFESIRIYKKYKDSKFSTTEEQAYQDAKDYIADYAVSGNLKTAATKTIAAKLEKAKLYGDYDCKHKENSEVKFIRDLDGNQTCFKINGVGDEQYELGFGIFKNKIPDNLEDLAEYVILYDDNMESWKKSEKNIIGGRKECEKDAIKMGEALEKTIYESYIIAKNGDIIRISDEEFKKRSGISTKKVTKDMEKTTEKTTTNDDKER